MVTYFQDHDWEMQPDEHHGVEDLCPCDIVLRQNCWHALHCFREGLPNSRPVK
jgi:hypothetical protein